MLTKPVLESSSARRMLDAALTEAEASGLVMTIAFVDDGGYPLVLQRMDGAGALTGKVALAKARTAALLRAPSAALHARIESDPALLALTDYLPMAGGLPIRAGGHCIGGVGVSGGSPEQDERIGAAALAAM